MSRRRFGDLLTTTKKVCLGGIWRFDDNQGTRRQAKNGRIWRGSNVEVTEVESRTRLDVKFIAKSGFPLSRKRDRWSLTSTATKLETGKKKSAKNVARPALETLGDLSTRHGVGGQQVSVRATGTLRTPTGSKLAKCAPLTPPPGGRVWAKPSPEAGRSFSIGSPYLLAVSSRPD